MLTINLKENFWIKYPHKKLKKHPMINPIILNIRIIVVEIFFLIAKFLYLVLIALYTNEHKKSNINNFQSLKLEKAFFIYSVLYSLFIISYFTSFQASNNELSVFILSSSFSPQTKILFSFSSLFALLSSKIEALIFKEYYDNCN